MSRAPEIPDVPEPDFDDYGCLAAWYSGYAFAEQYRKVVLAGCREAVRASATLSGRKVTESRLDDMARLHPAYLDFLAKHLTGRTKWEREFLAQGGMR